MNLTMKIQYKRLQFRWVSQNEDNCHYCSYKEGTDVITHNIDLLQYITISFKKNKQYEFAENL